MNKKKKKKEMKSIGKLKSKKKRTDEFWTCSQSKTHASQPRVHIRNWFNFLYKKKKQNKKTLMNYKTFMAIIL